MIFKLGVKMAKQKIVGVVKSANGANSYRINYRANGKKIQETVKADSKAEAFKIRMQRLIDVNNGVFIKKDSVTLDEFFQIFDRDYLASGVRENTRHEYHGNYNRYLSKRLGKIKLQNLKARDIVALYADLSDRLSGNTLKILHAYFRKMLNFAVQLDYILVNPINKVSTPKGKAKAFTVWSVEEINEFLNKAKEIHEQFYFVFAFTVMTGLRRSEVLGLQWKDIDYEKSTINLRRTVLYNKGKKYPVISSGKTDSSMGVLSIPSMAIDLLKEIQGNQIINKQTVGADKFVNSDNWIFTNEFGKLLHADYVTEVFNKVLIAMNKPVKEMSLKGFRHMFATLLVFANVNMKTIQALLRHSTYNLTANTYTHLVEGMQSQAVAQLDNIFIGAKNNDTSKGS